MLDFELKTRTSPGWTDCVLAGFDDFLLDHASCEKKASGMAISLISHYPDKPELIREMLNLAVEELNHYREVMRIILERGLNPGADTKDPYINRLHQAMNQGSPAYLMDRLLIASIVEARGAERFALLAQALPAGKLKTFYQAIADSESRHYRLFLRLTETHCNLEMVTQRLQQLLDIEASIVTSLPVRAALH